MSSFNQDLIEGQKGERDTIAKLHQFKACVFSMPSPNQHFGDYWMMTEAGTRKFVEIKTDSYASDNIALELWSTKGHSYGWANPKDTIYKYDLVVYHMPNKKRMITFTNEYARQFVKEHEGANDYGWITSNIKNSKAQCFMVDAELFIKRLKEYGDSCAKIINY